MEILSKVIRQLESVVLIISSRFSMPYVALVAVLELQPTQASLVSEPCVRSRVRNESNGCSNIVIDPSHAIRAYVRLARRLISIAATYTDQGAYINENPIIPWL